MMDGSERSLERFTQAIRRELRVRTWTPSRVDTALDELTERKHRGELARRRWVAIGGAALAVAAIVVCAVVALRALGSAGDRVPGVAGLPDLTERLALGEATEARFERGTELVVRERTDARVVVGVRSGTAHFKVRHDPRRLFRVEAGDVEVEDLGTTFEVEHRGSTVRVFVSEGSVAVAFPGTAGKSRRGATLRAGETGVYPSLAATVSAPSAESATADDAPAPQPGSTASAVAPAQPAADWRELARAGKHQRAYELLAASGFREVRGDAADLLLASDVARQSRHPARAAELLRRLLGEHASDSRAPSAAFTLGWVLMNELGRPREAALSFARAEALAPRGNLAEDALARSVEAWYRAGESSRAKAEVERYRRAYPRGRHQATLERLVLTP
jgi:transmembrane sensor